jgi:hypothetical protein
MEIPTYWVPGIAALAVTTALEGWSGIYQLRRGFLSEIGLYLLFRGAIPKIPAAGSPLSKALVALLLFVRLRFPINTEEIA